MVAAAELLNIQEPMAANNSLGPLSCSRIGSLCDRTDLMLLLYSDVGNANEFSNMIVAARKQYVEKMHPYAITRIASGNKMGKYKTYIGKPRKEVVRNTEEQLIKYLCDYYMNIEANNNTFGSILRSMLEDLVKENNRSLMTIATYKNDLENILPKEFFKRPINNITEKELKTIIVNQTKNLHPKADRLRKAIQLINRVFTYAIRKHVCQVNPAQYIDPDYYVSNCNNTRKKPEEKEFSDYELEKIKFDMLRTPDNPRALMVLLSKETGMRRSELCSLRWVDIEDKYIHIHRQQLKDISTIPNTLYEVQYTKDEREHPHDGRRFPLTPDIEKVLDLAKRLKGQSEYVFHDGDSWVLKDGYSRFLSRRCTALGITTTNNHAFRIALNNKLIRLGLGADERALILGHSVEVNERHYSNTDSRRLDAISGKLQ